jgi:hypothetical protein
MHRGNLVYTVLLVLCFTHVCETCINLPKRVKEHKTNCQNAKLNKSAVAKHAWTHDHRIKWDEGIKQTF